MPKFVIERDLSGAGNLTEEEIREASLTSLAVLRQLGPRYSGSTATSRMTRSTASTTRPTSS